MPIESPLFYPDCIPDGEFSAEKRSIEPLQLSDIPSFTRVMQEGILTSPYRTPEEREKVAGMRSADYYMDRISSEEHVLLVEKGEEGEILGGIETHIKVVDGQNVGHIHWVCVDENARGMGVATRLYEKYGQLMKERGDIFALMAYVDDENMASLKLHQNLGFREEFYRQEGGAWYVKRL